MFTILYHSISIIYAERIRIMKKKIIITLLASVTAGSFLLLSGCGSDQPNSSNTGLSAETESENLTDGTAQMHSVWYNEDNSVLSSATITILDGREELFSGTTDESGNLTPCSLPGNTSLTCEITDSTGAALAEGDIMFRISEDYSSLTIYPIHDGSNDEHVLEIPADKTDFRAAVFVTEDGTLSFANLSPYTESSEESDGTSGEESADGTSADQTGADTSAGQDGADATAGQNGTDAGAAQNTQNGTQPAQ